MVELCLDGLYIVQYVHTVRKDVQTKAVCTYIHSRRSIHCMYVYAGWIYTDPVTGARVKGRNDSAVCLVFWLYSHSTQHEPRTHAPEPCIVCLVWVVYWRNWFDPSRRTKLLNCKSKGPGDID
jgi:hypothetical protein